ncbi:MAG: Asp-tRNA(Asn)/Glu-tRNA(Gln) amidotransferase subunit GatB [Candidatus Hadarchaeales archaeon]
MQTKIGFEVHLQLKTERKLYCDCPTNYAEVPPNTNVCPICTGMPGAKPMMPNRAAVEAAVEISLMLGCCIQTGKPLYIQRKHYDYPDLPSGYQRTSVPLAVEGSLEGVRIREVHLEEDPGQYDPVSGSVDFNRSGIPLVEIVTEPDLRSPEEARRFLRLLTRVLEYTGKVRPEAGGAMRVDVNVSLEGGGRVEVKNINSVKGVYKALKFELQRQAERLRRGEKVKRETRAYLESQMITVPMRMKEFEEDYRYIPDPDLPPLFLEEEWVEEIRKRMVEPPHLREKRLVEEYGISPSAAKVITSERELADLFERVAKEVDPSFAADWFRTKLKKVLNYLGLRAGEVKFSVEQFLSLLKMVEGGKISREQGELVLRELVRKPREPEEILIELGLLPLEEKELEELMERVLEENKGAVEDYLRGREEALNFLTGKVLKASKGRADPREVVRRLKEKLEERRGKD